MEKQDAKQSYTEDDINKAFSMGLETAVFVIEKSLGLSQLEQQYILSHLKKRIIKDKVAVLER